MVDGMKPEVCASKRSQEKEKKNLTYTTYCLSKLNWHGDLGPFRMKDHFSKGGKETGGAKREHSGGRKARHGCADP